MPDLPFAILQAIEKAAQNAARGGINKARLGDGESDGFWFVFNRDFSAFAGTSPAERFDALWSLLRRGLVSIEMTGPPNDWLLHPTDLGIAAIEDPDITPEDHGEYRAELVRSIPSTSDTVLRYAMEAHRVYDCRAYLACAVMMGVASEVAVDELIGAYLDWNDHVTPGSRLREQVNREKSIKDRFQLFRRHMSSQNIRDAQGDPLPLHISDDLESQLDAVASAIRIDRNDAGHALGLRISHQRARALMVMLPIYLGRLYELRDWFVSETPLPPASST